MRRNLKKAVSLMLTVFLLAGMFSVNLYAAPAQEGGQWVCRDVTWYYENPDGSYATGWNYMNGSWYYLNDSTGSMYSGNVSPDGYYLGEDGAMVTEEGWQHNGFWWFYVREDGSVYTGWHYIQGAWYYFNEGDSPGFMYSERFSPDGYFLTDSGAMATEEGWYHIGNIWYYIHADGTGTYGWAEIDGESYYFSKDGSMAAERVTEDDYYVAADGHRVNEEGWQKTGSGGTCYVKADGKAAIGWTVIDGKEYYFEEEAYKRGNMRYNVEIDGKILGPDGAVLENEGWVMENGSLKFYDENGVQIQNTWYEIDGDMYYFDRNGSMLYDITNEEGYLFGTDGKLVEKTGWYETGLGSYYYVSDEGTVLTGWNLIDGKWYSFGKDYYEGVPSLGKMDCNGPTDDGYYVDQSGAMVTEESWQYTGYNWYYVRSDGTYVEGWYLIDGDWYFFYDISYGPGSVGKMAYSTTVDGYEIGPDGKMIE